MLWPFNLLRDEQIRCARHLIEKKPGTKKIYSTEIDMDPQRSKKKKVFEKNIAMSLRTPDIDKFWISN